MNWSPGGQWNDVPCTLFSFYPYICEKPIPAGENIIIRISSLVAMRMKPFCAYYSVPTEINGKHLKSV